MQLAKVVIASALVLAAPAEGLPEGTYCLYCSCEVSSNVVCIGCSLVQGCGQCPYSIKNQVLPQQCEQYSSLQLLCFHTYFEIEHVSQRPHRCIRGGLVEHGLHITILGYLYPWSYMVILHLNFMLYHAYSLLYQISQEHRAFVLLKVLTPKH